VGLCVSGENSYDVDDFLVRALQAVVVALVLCPIAAIGFAMRRLRQHI
jgi:hypothetical protein